MTITQVSEMFGISQDTLRYYERIGLIPSINRSKGGKRDYTEEDCKWIEFIKCMRNAGLSIDVLINYVTLFKRGDETIEARKEILIEQRKNLMEKFNEIKSTLEHLDMKIEKYKELGLKNKKISEDK